MTLTAEQTEELLDQAILTESDCLAIINSPGDQFGPIYATDLLEHKMGKSIATRFKRLDTAIIKLIEDVQKVFPNAQYYTASGGFTLMLGNPHNERGLVAQQELVALNGNASIGDGDF